MAVEGPCSPARAWETGLSAKGPVPLRQATLQARAGADVQERGLVLGMQLLENLSILHIISSFSQVLTTLSTESALRNVLEDNPLLAPRAFFYTKAKSKRQGQGKPEEGPQEVPRAQPGRMAEAFSSDQGGKVARLHGDRLTTQSEGKQSGVQPGQLELAGVQGHKPLGHSEEAGQEGGHPAQAGDVGENRAHRQVVLDGAAIHVP